MYHKLIKQVTLLGLLMGASCGRQEATQQHMRVFVKDLAGKTRQVEAATVSELKNQVYDQIGVPVAAQRLYFGRKELKSKNLRDHRIISNDTIGLSCSLLGGVVLNGPRKGAGSTGIPVSVGPEQMTCKPGINIYAYCEYCERESSAHWGFEGNPYLEEEGNGYMLDRLRYKSTCHVCGTRMKSHRITRFLFYKCKYRLYGHLYDHNANNEGMGKEITELNYTTYKGYKQYKEEDLTRYHDLSISAAPL